MELKEKDFNYTPAFDENDVEEYFSKREKYLWTYTKDWLSFYKANEIAKRQERWKKERLEQLIAAVPKIGRNSPCPCGSGKKYKKCCMGKETLH